MANRLPREILRRQKQGFAMPVAQWLTADLKDLMLDMLSASRLQRQGLFDTGYVEQLVGDHLARRRDNRKLIWTLLIFQLWYAKYIDGCAAHHGG
jgi:asparagine synthase (glutamine-hydrolysing)